MKEFSRILTKLVKIVFILFISILIAHFQCIRIGCPILPSVLLYFRLCSLLTLSSLLTSAPPCSNSDTIFACPAPDARWRQVLPSYNYTGTNYYEGLYKALMGVLYIHRSIVKALPSLLNSENGYLYLFVYDFWKYVSKCRLEFIYRKRTPSTFNSQSGEPLCHVTSPTLCLFLAH